ncbi:MAG: hypothetical protein AAGM38_00755 [Pseudomonadota bacterium]
MSLDALLTGWVAANTEPAVTALLAPAGLAAMCAPIVAVYGGAAGRAALIAALAVGWLSAMTAGPVVGAIAAAIGVWGAAGLAALCAAGGSAGLGIGRFWAAAAGAAMAAFCGAALWIELNPPATLAAIRVYDSVFVTRTLRDAMARAALMFLVSAALSAVPASAFARRRAALINGAAMGLCLAGLSMIEAPALQRAMAESGRPSAPAALSLELERVAILFGAPLFCAGLILGLALALSGAAAARAERLKRGPWALGRGLFPRPEGTANHGRPSPRRGR